MLHGRWPHPEYPLLDRQREGSVTLDQVRHRSDPAPRVQATDTPTPASRLCGVGDQQGAQRDDAHRPAPEISRLGFPSKGASYTPMGNRELQRCRERSRPRSDRSGRGLAELHGAAAARQGQGDGRSPVLQPEKSRSSDGKVHKQSAWSAFSTTGLLYQQRLVGCSAYAALELV